jgi:5-hydroxyisourate hydrolase
MAFGMSRISTHILDLMHGRPANDVPVKLERQQASGSWQSISSARTDQDGRCSQLLEQGELSPGVYRLSFDTRTYFDAHKLNGLYPVVEVTFHVRDGESRLHIPLLLSANGYTTYRGS